MGGNKMPSFHISSSGKVVQCSSDPCKLHAGSDFQAANQAQANQIGQNIIANTYKNSNNCLSKNSETGKSEQSSVTFDTNNNDNMIIADKDGTTKAVSFVNNMDVIEDACEQAVPEEFGKVFSFYESQLNEVKDKDDFELEKAINRDYEQNMKELVQDNWDKVYPLVKEDLI